MRLCASSWWTTSPQCETHWTVRCGSTATRSQLAADGREALDALADQPPDAIVLDVLMPEPDGLEVCRRLRAAGDRTPVLMLTARDAVADRVAGLDAGADDYLVKPFALEELRRALRALLRRTQRTRTTELLRFADLVLDPDGHTRQPRRAPDRAHPHRVPAAGAAPAPPAPGADAHADLRAASGATTSARARTRSRSTSATCAARSRRRRAAAASRRCAASATCCASSELPAPARRSSCGAAVARRRRARLRRSRTAVVRGHAARARSTTRCATRSRSGVRPAPRAAGTSVAIRRGDLLTQRAARVRHRASPARGRDRRAPVRAARRRRGPARRGRQAARSRSSPTGSWTACTCACTSATARQRCALFVARPLDGGRLGARHAAHALLLLALGGIGLAVVLSAARRAGRRAPGRRAHATRRSTWPRPGT